MMRRAFVLGLACWLVVTVPLAALTVSRVTVATTATLLYTAAAGGSTVLIRNAGSASVFLGDATVTTSTGFELVASDALSLPLGPNDTIYGIVATSTNRVDVLESRR